MEETNLNWRKASYSSNGGMSCVEVANAPLIWRKATYSSNGGMECVEVANAPGTVLVRDTTDRGGPSLAITAEAWQQFLATL